MRACHAGGGKGVWCLCVCGWGGRRWRLVLPYRSARKRLQGIEVPSIAWHGPGFLYVTHTTTIVWWHIWTSFVCRNHCVDYRQSSIKRDFIRKKRRKKSSRCFARLHEWQSWAPSLRWRGYTDISSPCCSTSCLSAKAPLLGMPSCHRINLSNGGGWVWVGVCVRGRVCDPLNPRPTFRHVWVNRCRPARCLLPQLFVFQERVGRVAARLATRPTADLTSSSVFTLLCATWIPRCQVQQHAADVDLTRAEL